MGSTILKINNIGLIIFAQVSNTKNINKFKAINLIEMASFPGKLLPTPTHRSNLQIVGMILQK
jgi:hypothetical protein